MKSSKDMLSSILKTAQISQSGIRSILDSRMQPGLRRALEAQLREFDRIENEAQCIASQRGWEIPDADPAIQFLSGAVRKAHLIHGNTDSKIADMIIRGNTRKMIQGLKKKHQFHNQDLQVTILSQKLLDCEAASIRQMQSFL